MDKGRKELALAKTLARQLVSRRYGPECWNALSDQDRRDWVADLIPIASRLLRTGVKRERSPKELGK